MTEPVGTDREKQQQVLEFHKNDDLNARAESHHHDLGRGRNQGSYGNHNHDGINSEALVPVTFTGSRGTDTANVLNQILNALVAIGATNNTNA